MVHKTQIKKPCEGNKPIHMEIPSTETHNTADKILAEDHLGSRGKRSTINRHKVTGLQVGFSGSGTESNHRMEIIESEG